MPERRMLVDLFVRSWVETSRPKVQYSGRRSTSSWGRELKQIVGNGWTWKECRPLREVVSWNLINSKVFSHSSRSTSSWGRELKHTPLKAFKSPIQSTSSWGRELNPFFLFCIGYQEFVDLFVRSWVEIHIRQSTHLRAWKSTSLWDRELKFTPFRIVLALLFVDLLVRSWVEIIRRPVSGSCGTVDLLARSWVEISSSCSVVSICHVDLLARSWVEILVHTFYCIVVDNVDLLVRSWVEMQV